jgi:hypothetical protein
VVSLEHAESKVLLGVLQVADTSASLSALLDSLLLCRSPRLDAIDSLPYRLERVVSAFEGDALHCDGSLVLGPTNTELLGVDTKHPAHVSQAVLGLTVGLVKGKVDIWRKARTFVLGLESTV